MAIHGHRHAEVYGLLLLMVLVPGPALTLPASTREGDPAPTTPLSASPAEFREARGPWSTLHFYARKRKDVARAPTPQNVFKVTKEAKKKNDANSTDWTSTVQQPRHWTMEEPTPSPVTTTTTMAPPTTRDYSGLYISPPIMVLDGNGERDNTRVVHDVLVVKNRPSRRPSTLRPPGSSNLVQPSIIRRPPPFWAGTAVPSGYGVSHAVLMNNHRPPSASSAFKRPFPGVTSIHIYPLTTAPSTTTSVYPPPGTIASVPLSVYDTVANTTIVHQNIITLSKPTYSSSSSSYSPSQTTTSSPPYMEEEDFGTTTEAMTESAETSQSSPSRPSTTEPLPDWAIQHQHQHRPVVTTQAPSSSLVAPIGSMPGILGPIGNLMQKFPTGSLSMFQNIGRIMAVLPTMLAAFLLTALLFV